MWDLISTSEIITPAAYWLKIVMSQTFLLKSEEYSCDSYHRSNLNMSDGNTNSVEHKV